MPENKKYFYIKLKENFFDTPEMRILQSLPKGYVYSDILLKLYLKTLNNAGKLVLRDDIELNVEMAAAIVGHTVKTTKKAFEEFEKLGFLTISDDGKRKFADVENFVGEGSVSADKKRIYRNKRKIELQEKIFKILNIVLKKILKI